MWARPRALTGVLAVLLALASAPLASGAASSVVVPRGRVLLARVSADWAWRAQLSVRTRVQVCMAGSWFDSLAGKVLGNQGDPGGAAADGKAAAGAAMASMQAQVEEALAAEDFDGYTLRQLLVDKWGQSYDVELAVTQVLSSQFVYLQIFPWEISRKPFRHSDERAYLEHLQAVAELLVEWGQCATVKQQIRETDKEPRRTTNPISTVPLRLNLPKELVRSFKQSRDEA
ncbi:hypothetical protein T492DRAFT_1008517 [Pavlovales sp. CCMP2436]|nr:hypothetical protein T492DRAFT_1008517 [Pavlovales sp. CCMP2436]|mmetsp:Transcript_43069/g.106282  ORF Transcript_43069/g.106282 Transcript_43069/m.106282 type:complete len:230 (-) Transcript_43069:79-768(-)